MSQLPVAVHLSTPKAEVEIDVDLVRGLLRAQHPDLADRSLVLEASGWDNATFRLGDDLAVRLPKREVAAALVETEQRWLPDLAKVLPLAIPTPVRIGQPSETYPWRWSVLPWLGGATADQDLPNKDQGEVLARFFRALHRPAPSDAPRNPYRGVPLVQRQAVFGEHQAHLEIQGHPLPEPVLRIWRDALAAPNDAAQTWLHGDSHPRNVLVQDGVITAFIDWGDMAQGDCASDLASIWMLLPDRSARSEAMRLYAASTATWARARGWAVIYVALLMTTGIADDPPMKVIAERTLARLLEGP